MATANLNLMICYSKWSPETACYFIFLIFTNGAFLSPNLTCPQNASDSATISLLLSLPLKDNDLEFFAQHRS